MAGARRKREPTVSAPSCVARNMLDPTFHQSKQLVTELPQMPIGLHDCCVAQWSQSVMVHCTKIT
jgi:hypothetical protein